MSAATIFVRLGLDKGIQSESGRAIAIMTSL